MNTNRHNSFFNPIKNKKEINIIGVGAVGSHIANNLARLGIRELTIWDIDKVDEVNIPNQMFLENQIGKNKTEAIKEYLQMINPEIKVNIKGGYTDEEVKGIVFMCVDSIDIRKKFYQENSINPNLKLVIDTRIALDDGQIYSAEWNNPDHRKHLNKVSDFKKEEVEVPVSACGTKLVVLPTTQMAGLLATSNFINYNKGNEIDTTILFNSFNFYIKKFRIK